MNPPPASAWSSPVEVWLRGNVRPVLGVAIAGGLAMTGLWAATLFSAAPPQARWLAAAVTGVVVAATAALVAVARRPRLACAGGRLLVRIAPLTVEAVPLDIVECFFPGSSPLDASGAPTADEEPRFRVGTLVIRIAERAAAYRQRATFRPWCTWEDGSIVIDGRWCEPLSPALARDLGGRLVAAKRVATTSHAEDGTA